MTDRNSIPRDIDTLIAALPATVRETLAELESAPRAAAETTIGLLPFGRRALLEAVNVTHTVVLDSDPDGAKREQVSITSWGWEVIRGCAAYEDREIDEHQQVQRSSELRAKLSAVPPSGG